MQMLLNDVLDSLTDSWGTPIDIVRQSPLVAVADNYDRIGFDPYAVTRGSRYSRYVSPTVMLRTHTSAAVPWLLKKISGRIDYDTLVAIPGLVYRRDSIDRTHVGAPQQVDLWRLASRTDLSEADLDKMIGLIVEAVLPGAHWRAIPARHPYTSKGRQVDVMVGGEWLELAECGLVAQHMFEAAGMGGNRWSGLALGMGLDRALMLRKGIDDIRLLRSSDPRISGQMIDLAPWRAVSIMPPIRRDISIVVSDEIDSEILGDSVRSALGDRAEDLEAVDVLSVTPYEALPAGARQRLSLRPDQSNVLVRITLRPLSATLTDPEANQIRDLIYLAVHEGPVQELIS